MGCCTPSAGPCCDLLRVASLGSNPFQTPPPNSGLGPVACFPFPKIRESGSFAPSGRKDKGEISFHGFRSARLSAIGASPAATCLRPAGAGSARPWDPRAGLLRLPCVMPQSRQERGQ